MKDRKPYNKVLVEFMAYLFEEFQEVRFFQALMDFYKPILDESANPFYQEPWETLERLENELEKFGDRDFIEKINELKEKYLDGEE